ncbi:hematopoietic progenitor cell antigen CD34 isoform X2 [Salmo salar]|uniref:Hematopoietic progenitor cell antigen CD34 isoform X2 n=1 Tax=Salmo salar TaxID=8030 RepID=A0A1S3LKW8_SALSA|nr:hematopoietic progenitor cell antigen CD34-like isoform X2 [Salmo salar]|eukprot:XP_013991618.1 PREDICTED: hematopoietic progenitor cell antigen CD34-like isoform X2 [Salmo salar]
MKPAEHKPRFILPVCPAPRAQETRNSPSPHSLIHHSLSHTSTDTHTQRLTKDWRMAVSMRRMNGSRRGMALAVVLCTLLLHNEVHCQDSIDTPYTSDAKDAPGAATTDAPVAAPTDSPGAAPTDAPGAAPTDALAAAPTDALAAAPTDTTGTDATIEPQAPVDDKATTVANSTADNTAGTSTPVPDQDTAFTPVPDQDTDFTPVPDQDTDFTSMVPEHDPVATGDTSGTTAGPGVDTQGTEATDDPGAPVVQLGHQAPVFVLPIVECVDKEAVKDKDTVKVELSSETSCSVTKRIMEDSAWCTGDCNLKLFQEENSNTLVLTRANGGVKELSESLNSQDIKGQLGVVEAAPQWGKHSSTVLVSLLITGLLLAATLIGGYCLKKHCRHNAKGMRLAEDAYPVDEENQGNTLVSVAPLNPLETQEKPANGDSQEAAKTQPPPTNGHSTTNLADTEL